MSWPDALQGLHVNANGNYALKTGIGVFASVTVNTKGTSPNTLTIYDGLDATGTVLAVVDTSSALGTFLYDIVSRSGIFAVLSGGVAADLTIAWL